MTDAKVPTIAREISGDASTWLESITMIIAKQAKRLIDLVAFLASFLRIAGIDIKLSPELPQNVMLNKENT
ncbi:MAG: hypothetical protein IPJ07_04765 [Acidobacteria bacterium]|nr:hypothetical protein [Acidobacteriota bacterium]